VVSSVQDGVVSSEVAIRLPGGTTVVASITRESAHALALKDGDAVSVVVKASNVMLGM
jgi:molybdate transport system regulatory protein